MSESHSGNTIVFNGEIYGFKEIKQRYGDYNFKTHSDTELILAMYNRHGKALANQLPGMFSFALWDEKNKALFAARDRFGEKPFYYALIDNTILCASEMKAIIATNMVSLEIDEVSIDNYLTILCVPPWRTIY